MSVINRGCFILITARRRRASSQVCTNLGLVDDYLDACEYDVESTGDESVSTLR